MLSQMKCATPTTRRSQKGRAAVMAVAGSLAAGGAACVGERAAEPPAVRAPAASPAPRSSAAGAAASAPLSAPEGSAQPSAPATAAATAIASAPPPAPPKTPLAAEVASAGTAEDALSALRRWSVSEADIARATRGQAAARTRGHPEEEIAGGLAIAKSLTEANLDGDPDGEGVVRLTIEDSARVMIDGAIITTTFVVFLDATGDKVSAVGSSTIDAEDVTVETKPIHTAAFHDVVLRYESGGACGLGCFAPEKVKEHLVVLTAERGKVETLYEDAWLAFPANGSLPKSVDIEGPPPSSILVSEAVDPARILQRKERTLRFDAAAFKYR
jgi:hypothetical protein